MRREYGLESTTFSLSTEIFWRGLEPVLALSDARDIAIARKESLIETGTR